MNKNRDEKEDTITDITEMKRVINYYKQPYANKLERSQRNKFLSIHLILDLNQQIKTKKIHSK